MRKSLVLVLYPVVLSCVLIFIGCGGGGGTNPPVEPTEFFYPTGRVWTGDGDTQQPPGEPRVFGWMATDQDKPSYPVRASHLGIDIRGSSNSPIYALTDGVIAANWTDATDPENKALWARHNLPGGGSFYTVYGHVNSSLRPGTQVKAGEQIARIANQSNPHLHLGIRPSGVTAPWGRGTIPKGWSIKSDPNKQKLPKNGWAAPRSYLESRFDSGVTAHHIEPISR